MVGGRARLLLGLGLAAAYVTTLSAFAHWAQSGLRTAQMDDLGKMAQALCGGAHGDWMMTQSNAVACRSGVS
jgi:hypothetical protein